MKKIGTAAGLAAMTIGVAVLSGAALANGTHGAAKPESAPKPSEPAAKVYICHATGSASNPYVLIHVSSHALSAHTGHQSGHDIVLGSTKGTCPTAAPAAPASAASVASSSSTSAPSSNASVTKPNEEANESATAEENENAGASKANEEANENEAAEDNENDAVASTAHESDDNEANDTSDENHSGSDD